ncbi:MAG: hypothetical protein ABI835_16875 [Chloroflexota bacterium]
MSWTGSRKRFTLTQKRKRDPVSIEMRDRLRANRDGRLTPAQWGELIVQPLIVLVLLSGFALAALGPRLLPLLRFWWILLPALLLMVLLPAVFRAYRYARAPIHFVRLLAGAQTWHGIRKPMLFHTEADETIKFPKRLAPRLPLVSDAEYIVYYLEEPQGKVLLSAAPADHDDAEAWLPSKSFAARQQQRSARS